MVSLMVNGHERHRISRSAYSLPQTPTRMMLMNYLKYLKQEIRDGWRSTIRYHRQKYDESSRLKNFLSYIGGEDFLGVAILLLGLLGYFQPGTSTLLADLAATLIGIGITVLIIDNAGEVIKRREEKKRLILQMGSPDNAFAVEAVRQLKERGWLVDGSLHRAELRFANLSNVDLSGADLREVDLSRADLSGSYLYGSNLAGAILREANLSEAILFRADVSEANLFAANIVGADLRYANLKGSNLEQVKNLSEEQLAEAIIDKRTILLSGLD